MLDLKYANNPQHKKIGWQLWGTFQRGKWTGWFRLCFGHKYTSIHLQFYKECKLNPNIWADQSSRRISIWNFRWRVKDDLTGSPKELMNKRIWSSPKTQTACWKFLEKWSLAAIKLETFLCAKNITSFASRGKEKASIASGSLLKTQMKNQTWSLQGTARELLMTVVRNLNPTMNGRRDGSKKERRKTQKKAKKAKENMSSHGLQKLRESMRYLRSRTFHWRPMIPQPKDVYTRLCENKTKPIDH